MFVRFSKIGNHYVITILNENEKRFKKGSKMYKIENKIKIKHVKSNFSRMAMEVEVSRLIYW